MKKTIFAAVLGLAACAATSYGQGYVVFTSYGADAPNGALTTLADGITPIGVGFTADLYYFLGTVSDPVTIGTASTLPTGLTDLGVSVAYDNSGSATGSQGLGFFDGSTVTIPGYVSGPVTFEVVAFNGSSYANSTIRGRSGAFTMTSIASSLQVPTPYFGVKKYLKLLRGKRWQPVDIKTHYAIFSV
jgi:hypothetical protein